MRVLVIITAVILFAGCSRTTSTGKADEKNAQAPGKSTAMQVVEGMTGKTAVDSGRKARATIEKVSAQENQNIDEILGK